MRVETFGDATLYLGDCREVLPTLDPVDLILTDPPYFKVKGESWDRQWEKPEQFLEWLGGVADLWSNALAPNGSLYCFASPQMSARVEILIAARFQVLNAISWFKREGWHKGSHKEGLRAYFPATERIIFAEHQGADSMAMGEAGYDAQCEKLRGFVFEPLRAYLDGERRRAGVDKADCNAACGFSRTAGGMASRHYFSLSQWCLPTREHYDSLRRLFNDAGGEFLRREYEELRREYEELRREYEELRRPFSVSPDVPYTDVWEFPTVAPGIDKHPCEKPRALLSHAIKASSRPGAIVMDSFMGTGSAGLAAHRAGRHFVGIEMNEGYFDIACRRIEAAANQGKLF